MIIEVNKRYKDKSGNVWKVIEVRDQGRHPVTAARWDGKAHRTRTYQRDGKFYVGYADMWDLVEEVVDEPAREGS